MAIDKCVRCDGPCIKKPLVANAAPPATDNVCEECEKPIWMKEPFSSVWTEDNSLPIGGETMRAAWFRMFGERLILSACLAEYDGGEADYYLMPRGRIAVMSYPGSNEIRELTACECGDRDWHTHGKGESGRIRAVAMAVKQE